jgi:high-affinity Fe2+/Pb2+ permease
MGKREIYLLIATIGIEITAVGVGEMVSPSYGWCIAGLGLVVFIVFLIFALRTKEKPLKQFSIQELEAQTVTISERIESRKKYLPYLKQA